MKNGKERTEPMGRGEGMEGKVEVGGGGRKFEREGEY